MTDAPSPDRWATFDCYGTLVDWRTGIASQLTRLLGDGVNDAGLLPRYYDVEARIQAEQPTTTYREVMAQCLAELAAEEGKVVPEDERDALGRSLPSWPVFPEVPASLAEAKARDWRLVALTNSDPDFIAASVAAIGVPFDLTIPASAIGSYKPDHGHWRAFTERTDADPARHVHVAQSHFHDIVPANELGIPSIWINRLGDQGEPRPTRELPDLNGLADTLDEIVPAPS